MQGDLAKSWTVGSIVRELRSSEAAVKDSLERLQTCGLVIEVEPERYQYRPANAELDALALSLKQLYLERPYTLMAEIAAGQSPGIQSFADAFKIRKD